MTRLEKQLGWDPERQRRYLATPKGKAHTRRAWLKQRHGMAVEEYDAMLKAQGGGCAICGRADGGRKDGWRLAVDHDHESGQVRGLLCASCNQGLGRFKDNPELLFKAAGYLRKPTKSA